MRVSTSAGFERVTQRLNALQAEADALTAQLATGKKFASPADAPADAARISTLGRTLAEGSQATRNLDIAANRLTLADTALDSASNLLIRARELGLAAVTGTANTADRASAAAELAELSEQLLALANSRDASDDRLFAGAATRADAYVRDISGAVVWQGTGTPPLVPLDGSRTIVAGEPGPAVFGDVFARLDALRAVLSAPILDIAAANAALDGLEAAANRVGDARARFGARLAGIESERDRLAAQDLDLTERRATLEGTDVAAATIALSRTNLLLQATRDTFARVRTLSLFDSLR